MGKTQSHSRSGVQPIENYHSGKLFIAGCSRGLFFKRISTFNNIRCFCQKEHRNVQHFVIQNEGFGRLFTHTFGFH